MFFVFIVYFILSLVIGSAAAQRGRSAVGWFLVSILTTPLLAGVFLLLFPSLHDPALVDDRALQESINKGQAVGSPKKQAVGGFFVLLAIMGFAIFVIVKNGERDASQVNETSSEQTLVPRGSEKPSFDCSKAKTAPARLICADAELARLDGQLGATFQDRKTRLSGLDQSNLNSEQLAWIKDRNTHCDLDGKSDAAIEVLIRSKPCMADAIRKRIAVLAQIESATTVGCHRDGDVITVQGIATAQTLELANGLIKNVWLLVTDKPICVVDSIAVTKPPYEVSVSRIQIIGQPPPTDTAIELTGKLSTGNITQYYAESKAIVVISGHRISAGPHDSPKFDPNQVAALLDNGDSASSVATSPAIANGKAEFYCDAVKENIARVNQSHRNLESTFPPENPNSPKNPNYKPTIWQVLSCDEISDPNHVVGMLDVGGGYVWHFEALKSAYPFRSGSDDIRVFPTVGGYAPPPSSSVRTWAQSVRPVTKAFTECLLSQGRSGSYTSFDGGQSAIRLMGDACKAQWDAWQAECIANGGTDGGWGGCTMQAGLMAQVALKLLGK